MTGSAHPRSSTTSTVRRPSACEYAYDATGLLARIAAPGQTGERFWRGKHAVNELRTSASGSAQLTWLRAVGQPIVEQVSGAVARVTLLATAISGSVLLEADTAVRAVAYAPHGSRPDGEQAVGVAEAEPAFNGELLDAASGCYLLGAGHHRPYSPRLGIFLAADRLSPFGAGGVNPYAYCAGDPVNRSDPTGHFWKWIVAAVGIAVGVAAVAVTFGAASKAVAAVATVGFSALTKSTAGAIASTTLGVVAVGAEVGAIAAEVSGDTKTASILGFVGLALGIVAAAPAIAKAATKGAAKFSRFTKRIATIRSQGLSGRGAAGAGANMARRGSMLPGSSAAPTTPGAGGSSSRLVGYHGTSIANANEMLTDGAKGIYLTDMYASASHYAKVAQGKGSGVVLAMYSDDVANLRAFSPPKLNATGIAEVRAAGQPLRAEVATSNASAISDFFDFWDARVLSRAEIAEALRARIAQKRLIELDKMYEANGMTSPPP
ncbi:RHS repeat-associated core domain-containing protein [Stenotrophomonas sp.]|uniref:RHS repeat-associated core domain-containing protein n=1 Tax=Stenotrophomonas sp. TaxID=69392 RepID=UPI002896E38D|nr:RHS repeat-associated core domain-containing protein [Stenotrophomonas sp.]